MEWIEHKKRAASEPQFTEILKKKQIIVGAHWTLVLKVQPARPGHLVAVSNRKYVSLSDISEEQCQELVLVSKLIAFYFTAAENSEDFFMFSKEGKGAGQQLLHVHVHFVPGKGKGGEDEIETFYGDLSNARPGGNIPRLKDNEIGQQVVNAKKIFSQIFDKSGELFSGLNIA